MSVVPTSSSSRIAITGLLLLLYFIEGGELDMASTAARASLPAISATNSSTLRIEIVYICANCANWCSESRDDRVSSGCFDIVRLLTTVGVEIAACYSSREIKMFRGLATPSRHRDAEDLPYHSRSY